MTEESPNIPPIPNPPPVQPSPPSSDEGQAFVQALKDAVDFLKLDFSNLDRVANDPKMPVWVIVILAISGVASAIGTFNIPGIIINPIFSVIFGSVFILLFWVLAGPIFGGKATVIQHYNSLGLLAVVQWITVIPILGPLVSFLLMFYLVFVYQRLIKVLHSLSEGKAWAVVLIPIAVMFFLGLILIAIFGIAIFGFIAAAANSG